MHLSYALSFSMTSASKLSSIGCKHRLSAGIARSIRPCELRALLMMVRCLELTIGMNNRPEYKAVPFREELVNSAKKYRWLTYPRRSALTKRVYNGVGSQTHLLQCLVSKAFLQTQLAWGHKVVLL